MDMSIVMCAGAAGAGQRNGHYHREARRPQERLEYPGKVLDSTCTAWLPGT